MSVEVVRAVRAQYPATLTDEMAVKVCNEVAYVLNGQSAVGPYGLHQKGGANWAGCARDIVGIRDTGTLVDILGGVTQPNGGTPQWIVVPGTLAWAPVRLEWLPGTLPPVDPPPADDLASRVAALEGRVRRLEFRQQAAGEALTGL